MCTPNPYECGGSGGCDGATVELGFAYTQKHGLGNESSCPYLAHDDAALKKKTCPAKTLLKGDIDIHHGESFGFMSFETLTQNSDDKLAQALVDYGPVAISGSANEWMDYEGGIFNSCGKDAVVDHAITLYGYGVGKEGAEAGKKYWFIRNSWGADWGEKGFLRLLRHDVKAGEKHPYCGMDNSPLEGLGCKSGPNKVNGSVEVCGMCGILFDSVVPYFAGSKKHPSLLYSIENTQKQLEAEDKEDEAEDKEDEADAGKKVEDQQHIEAEVLSPQQEQQQEDESDTKNADPHSFALAEEQVHKSKVASLMRVEAKRH